MEIKKSAILIVTILVIAGAAVLFLSLSKLSATKNINQPPSAAPQPDSQGSTTPEIPVSAAPPSPAPALAMPISNALSRVTKKPFGIFVTPKNSPVQPERFTGYHTGADFETTPAEASIDVPVYAICNGVIKVARAASGYGGVIVESCNIYGQTDTVIYGHVRQSSIITKIGQTIKAGNQIAVLGTGYSSETDGERKHLHLGIHRGTAINISGYVQNKNELSGWADPLTLLK